MDQDRIGRPEKQHEHRAVVIALEAANADRLDAHQKAKEDDKDANRVFCPKFRQKLADVS